MILHLLGLLLLLSAAPVPAAAQAPCGAVDHAAGLAESWLALRPARSPGPDLSMSEAICIQAALVRRLAATHGPPIGYKVGLTSAAAQQQFGVTQPVVGVLLASMLVPEGTDIAARFGARPALESDLLVAVRDAGVNGATTPLEVAGHLGAIVPFIELPDLVLAEGEALTSAVIVAINVGARLGVIGTPAPVLASAEFVAALATMQVVMTDQTGAELARAPGAAILGHPLNSVPVLAAELARRGTRLKAGDIVSLGGFGRPLAPRPGQTVTLRYDGLPGAPLSVAVRFK